MINGFNVDEEENKWSVHSRKVFAVLNKRQLSLFENENVNGLIKSINLDQIQRTSYILDSSVHCFDLLPAQAMEEIVVTDDCYNRPHTFALSSLCFKSEGKEKEWLKAVADFKTCDIRIIDDPLETVHKYDIL